MIVRYARVVVTCTAVLLLAACRGANTPRKFIEQGNAYFEKRDYARAILEYKNAMQAKPQDPEVHYRMSLAVLESGDAKSAVALLRKALSLDPKHTSSRKKLVELMAFSRGANSIREANQQLEELLSSSPDDVEGLRLLAITDWRLGKTEDAEKHLKQALAKSPNHLQSLVTLAWMNVQRKNMAEAERLLTEALARAGSSTASLMALGRFYIINERWSDAEAQFRSICDREPLNGDALVDLARVQMEMKNVVAAEQSFRRLSTLPDKKFRVLLPVFLFQTGRHDDSVKELKRMLAADSGDRNARSLLVSAYLQQKRTSDAEELLKQALTKNGKDIEAHLQRARIYLLRRNWIEAQNDLSAVLSFEPGSAEAHFLLSKVHAGRGELLLQRQELTAAVQLDRNLLPARIDLSKHLIAGRDPKGALQVISDTPEHQANMVQTIVQRHWALLAMKNYTEVRQRLGSMLEAVRTPDLLLQDAVLKLMAKDIAGARKSLEEILNRRPSDVRALQALAVTYVIQRDVAAALAIVREHASRQPDSPAVQALAGRWMLHYEDYTGARNAYMRVRALEGDPVPVDLMLAEIDRAEGKLHDARQRLSALVALPSATATVFHELGNIHEVLKDRDAAIGNYRKAVELNPRHTWALNNLAFLLAEHAAAADEALKYAQQAMEALPDDNVIEDTLGWVYYRKGVYNMAIKHLENAVTKGGGASTRYHLAAAYAKAGQHNRAEHALRAALKMAPDLPEAILARDVVAATAAAP